jgi:hypothetical protein
MNLIEPCRFTPNAANNVDRILKYDSSDYRIGGSTQIRYSGTTRLLVKPAGDRAVSRNLLTVSLSQTYYTDPNTSQIDPDYSTAFLGRPPSAFSPISLLTVQRRMTENCADRADDHPALKASPSAAKTTHVLVATFSHRRLSPGVGGRATTC